MFQYYLRTKIQSSSLDQTIGNNVYTKSFADAFSNKTSLSFANLNTRTKCNLVKTKHNPHLILQNLTCRFSGIICTG